MAMISLIITNELIFTRLDINHFFVPSFVNSRGRLEFKHMIFATTGHSFQCTRSRTIRFGRSDCRRLRIQSVNEMR